MYTELVQINSASASFALITIISVLAADRSLGSVCWGLAESNSRHVSAGHCLKFHYCTPSFAMLSTLNDPQYLYPEYFEATYPVKWTLAHESAGKPQCGMIGALSCWNRSQCWKNGEYLAVIFVRLCIHSNRHHYLINIPSADARRTGSEYLCKLNKEYVNVLTHNYYSFFLNKILDTFDILQAWLNVAKLLSLKTVRILAHPVETHFNQAWYIYFI